MVEYGITPNGVLCGHEKSLQTESNDICNLFLCENKQTNRCKREHIVVVSSF